MPDKAFFMVWNGNIITPPKKQHISIEDARAEARRLAQENQGVEFFVLRVLEGVKYTDSPWRNRTFSHGKGE